MQEAILKIQKIGAPPEGFEDGGCPEDEDFPSDELCDLWDEYQDAADSITRPITWEEAEILISGNTLTYTVTALGQARSARRTTSERAY